jgi:hypothetical protein
MNNNTKLVRETLDWIDSLESPKKTTGFGYFDSTIKMSKEESGLAMRELQKSILAKGLYIWRRKYRSRRKRHIRSLRLESNCTIRLQDIKSRLCLKKWKTNFMRSSLTVSQIIEMKRVSGEMAHSFKLGRCLAYWNHKAQLRRILKRSVIFQWKKYCWARNLMIKVFCP